MESKLWVKVEDTVRVQKELLLYIMSFALYTFPRLLKEANGILEDYDDQRELQEQIGRLLDTRRATTAAAAAGPRHIFQPFEFVHVRREGRAGDESGMSPQPPLAPAYVLPDRDYAAPQGGHVKVEKLRQLAVNGRLTNTSGKLPNGSAYEQGVVVQPLGDERDGQLDEDGGSTTAKTPLNRLRSLETPLNRQVRPFLLPLLTVQLHT
jgi:hypothetical protein